MRAAFQKFSEIAAKATGSPWAFCLALTVVVLWSVSGPIFGFSDTWQLIINTGTTIVTFVMVFLIQNAQNRDSLAVQLKLDELLRCMKGARVDMVDLEEMSEEELGHLREQFEKLARAKPQRDTTDKEERAKA
ncbi:low affinity iron permease family protein [Allopusillimonas ginsengisoli]|nr:low affinity iron permease family protein [Allopusillimonas ginsengisoli]